MAQTCTKCSRVNPPEAAFCYFDGAALAGHSRISGPMPIASQPFTNPFVFPTGRACRNFDELALACHENWQEACDLLGKGHLQSFFSGLGRADLSSAARDAAKFPDRDRALDQLLGQLPSGVLDAPRLRVEPPELNLGTMELGRDRTVHIRLCNQGMRLLHGTVTCDDCPWLLLGEAPGMPQKHFQFDHELAIPVHIRGAHLRAGVKPLEGNLTVESNGGAANIGVRVDVPVTPFSEGPLAGAISPRQIAEKARAAPKETAAFFENGAVAQWYKDNGWTYPVQGPSASGLGAVQQFFEALGLTAPPKVDVSERSIILRGDPGHQLRHVLRVEAQEKRPVYAYGKSNQPWLEVGKPQLNGRVASIPLVVPNVPHRPGERLTAKLQVQANGNQRFLVPITLEIGAPPAAVFDFSQLSDPVPSPPPVAKDFAPSPPVEAAPAPRVAKPRQPFPWVHAVPALLLAVVLGGVVTWDIATKNDAPGVSEPEYTDSSEFLLASDAKDPEPRVAFEFSSERMQFGIQMTKEQDPDNPGKRKKLTYEERGESNNTCIWIDHKEPLFGWTHGGWMRLPKDLSEERVLGSLLGPRDEKWLRSHRGSDLVKVPLGNGRDGYLSVWQFPEQVRVYQSVERVVGEQTYLIDTVLVRYTLENHSEAPHTVGLRVMIDTFIGVNDGVPFTIPGQKQLVTKKQDFGEKDIPDFIQALERDDLDDPGTVAHMGLRGFRVPNVKLSPIEKLRICRWPGTEARWEWEAKDIDDNADGGHAKDSCVVLYWMPRKLDAGERRDMAFTYGLNRIAAGRGSRLGLTAGGRFRTGGEFTLTAYVKNPQAGQRITLEPLPEGLKLIEGQDVEQSVPAGGDYTQVSWRVRALQAGDFLLSVSSGAARAGYTIHIRGSGLFR